MSKLVGVGKVADDDLGAYRFVVVRTRGDSAQKWAYVHLEESAQQIADAANARQDGWTYEVRGTE